jgi:hypothetical protein
MFLCVLTYSFIQTQCYLQLHTTLIQKNCARFDVSAAEYPRISFFWDVTLSHLNEIPKNRFSLDSSTLQEVDVALPRKVRISLSSDTA